MNHKLFLHFSAGLILINLVGCVLPGQAPPMPTIDMQAVETSIAGTGQASAQTQAAYTPTPIPPTSTPPISLISGTSLARGEDGKFLFNDHRAGIQLTVPADWLPVRINEDEYYKAFTHEVAASNPAIIDRLTRIQTLDSNIFRLVMIGIRPDHTLNGIISDVSVIFEQGDTRTLEEWLKAERGRQSLLVGWKFLNSEYHQTADGRRILVIEQSWNGTNGGTIYYRGVFFSLPTGTLVLDLQTNMDIKDTIILEYEQMFNSVTPIQP